MSFTRNSIHRNPRAVEESQKSRPCPDRNVPGVCFGSREAGGEVTIPLRLTQSDLGEIVGASRERVNQVVVELKQRGLIAVQPDHWIRGTQPP